MIWVSLIDHTKASSSFSRLTSSLSHLNGLITAVSMVAVSGLFFVDSWALTLLQLTGISFADWLE